MPGDLKIRGGTRKYVLKQALRGLLPDAILDRSKEGFSIPMKTWLRGDLRPMMERLLAPDRLRDGGLIDAGEVTRLMARTR